MTLENEVHSFTIIVERVQDFEFRVQFDNPQFPELYMDEPKPLGHEQGPNAARVLSAAIGNCLSASLMFCLQRSKLMVDSIRAEVTPNIKRNENGRWRIQHMQVKLKIGTSEKDPKRIQRCIEIFENYCIVTASVRQGIPIDVEVLQRD